MATLSSLLVQRGVATMRAVEDAIARQVLKGGDLATNVLEVGAGREDDVTHLAAQSVGLAALGPGRVAPADPGVLRLLPGDVAERHGIFPIERRGGDLVVATSEPLSQRVVEDLGFLLNLDLRPVYALRARIAQALAEHYGQPLDRRYARLLAKLEGRKLAPETEPPPAPPRAASEPPPAATTSPRAASEPPPAPPAASEPAPVFVPAMEPRRIVLTPQRPTLRGLPKVVDDGSSASGPTTRGDATAALPTTIELSPRPPAAAEPVATELQKAAAAAAQQVAAQEAALEAAAREASAREAAAKEALALEVAAREAASRKAAARQVAAREAATLEEAALEEAAREAAARASSAREVAPKEATLRDVASKEAAGLPRAIAAWAKAPATDARTPRPGRARRKGPFPAGLAEEEMQSAVTTDGVLEVFFDFAQQFFEYSALFVVHGDIAEGRDAAGRGADRERVATIGLPLDLPSTLASSRDRRVPVLGELAAEGLDAELLRDLGRAPAGEGFAASPTAPSQRAAAVVVPVVVRGRSVALLFGDDAPHPVELGSIGEVIAFAALAGASIERIILRRKMGRAGGASASARLSPGALLGAAKSVAASSAPVASSVVAASSGSTAPTAPFTPSEPFAPAMSFAPSALAAAAATVAPVVAAPRVAVEVSAPKPAPAEASQPAAREVRRTPPRAGVAALARMFSSSAPASTAAKAPAPAVKESAVVPAPEPADVWDTGPNAPPAAEPREEESAALELLHPRAVGQGLPRVVGEALPRGRLGALAAVVAESLVASQSEAADEVSAAAASSEGAPPAAPSRAAFEQEAARAADETDAADESGGASEVLASADESRGASEVLASADESRGASEVLASADESGGAREVLGAAEEVGSGHETGGAYEIGNGHETGGAYEIGSAAYETGVAHEGGVVHETASDGEHSIALALQTPSFDGRSSFVEQESSGEAMTVALLLPGDTPPPAGSAWDAVSEASSDSADVETLVPEEDIELVDIDEVEDIPDEALETVAPGATFEPAAETDSGAQTIARDAPVAPRAEAPLSSERPLSSEEGRASAPVVVDVFADSTDGLASAIARAAEAVDARVAQRARERAEASAAGAAPPEETLTEGFPASAPTRSGTSASPGRSSSGSGSYAAAHASPDVPAAAAFATPSPADARLSALGLEALLARAARGVDAAEARAELQRRADRNLTPLLALFPGPLDQDRNRSADRLPPASLCGPLLEAIVHTGARGAATVAVLARHDDVDVRFWAAHLLGELPSAEAADGLLAFLVDGDAAVRRIALRSAGLILSASLGGRPLESALGFLARNAHSPLRERLAAIEAMGQLRGSFFVPILAGLLGATPEEVSEAARRALLVVTRQDFGRDVARWNDWWSKNEAKNRIEWLIDALMHETQSIRRAAGDELKQLTKEYFGYYDDLPKRERERAQERYRDWWDREGRGRFS